MADLADMLQGGYEPGDMHTLNEIGKDTARAIEVGILVGVFTSRISVV